MQQENTQGTEAIRAMATLRQCWTSNEEIYINKGCLHCGAAATYLIYFTNRNIQNSMLNFIQKYNCNRTDRFDLLDIEYFASDYECILTILEQQIIAYAATTYSQQKRSICFEDVSSIFERELNMAC